MPEKSGHVRATSYSEKQGKRFSFFVYVKIGVICGSFAQGDQMSGTFKLTFYPEDQNYFSQPEIYRNHAIQELVPAISAYILNVKVWVPDCKIITLFLIYFSFIC